MGGPHGKAYMGWWGSMGSPKQKYITSYAVSPYAQKPLAGIFHNAVFNTFRRVRAQALYVIIPFGLYYAWWANCRDYNEFLYTKAGREELERVNN
ncbi:AEL121Wp [Eremothecium gossypii ATCC 10895]|uniref:Cytochrome b-c1 complex subunit 8 n=1 Tax=Eremothecium gossypii (strain ATCC 10895 / CBS 109.51 / FGSC 9923 / NRRL Y-1056) TaxID=284811 RepID=Q757Y1_EREGS|nr:AEL121Wp [Eremothecium gossypii ATCC 10895]AAS52564.1 AEL121Wp [Eremothecium gossypii ATCC 10895]AEY96865.1 FAEL121Wp [Eremothecium gossypii FDAG1]